MRLTAFRIRNFRSIVDTGWQTISHDNITCLIGQNESGKTSVLEGLYVFSTGEITEDVLRSDLTLPEVSCRFAVEKGWMLKEAPDSGTELRELLEGTDLLELTRSWQADFTSLLTVSGPVREYLDSLESAWQLYLSQVTEQIDEEQRSIDGRRELLDISLSRLADLEERLRESVKRGGRKGRFLGRRETLTAEDKSLQSSLRKEIDELNSKVVLLRKEATESYSLATALSRWCELGEELADLERRLADVCSKLERRHQMMTLLMKPDDYDEASWDVVLADYRMLKRRQQDMRSALDIQTAVCGAILGGATASEAKERAEEISGRYRSEYTGELLGARYFNHIPSFVMFEDFGSLLPNRIDLDDIVSDDTSVEGYKAARNFLTLARLDYSFFIQPSSRILKQTIENLNQELTRNFQDFWQQSVGERNKIKIQFELEHYSASHGEKAGKPYLEFWIKDEGERLYPKQRSRGVRWFLSFYLELKASACRGDKPIVLLADEPGVSLHARAQEDVLKVFEDISDKIQVVYTTHSPHLVDIERLHRVLAVQRDDVDSYRSSTRVIDPVKLSAASPDTLTPIHSVMGNPFAGGFSNRNINLIVSNNGTYYFITAILKLVSYRGKLNIVPSTDVKSVPLLCNIMVGWGLDFAFLQFGNQPEQEISRHIGEKVFRQQGDVVLAMPDKYSDAEDLLSTIDFKRHVLKEREGITVSNSEFVTERELPRDFLASRFLSEVNSGSIKSSDFDEESLENFRLLTGMLQELK